MSRQVQLRRGTAVQHQTFTGLVGELTMNTTNNSLRLHDNVLNGGHEMLKANMSNVLISSNGTFSLLDNLGQVSVRITNVANPTNAQDVATKAYVDENAGTSELDDLTDVDIDGDVLEVGQTLRYDGTNFVNSKLASTDLSDTAGILLKSGNLAGLNNPATARNNLGLGTSAVLDTGTGVDQVLKFTVNNTLPAISGVNLTALGSINTLSDVDTDTNAPNNGQFLKWNGANWVPADGSSVGSINDLSDVDITGIVNGQFLKWNGTTFVDHTLVVADISDGNTLATTITTTAIQNELDTTQTSVGLNANGALPVYISTHYIADNDSHHLSLGNLDNALANTDATLDGLTVTVGTKLPSADFTATNIKNLVNANNTGLNADLLDNLNSDAFVQVTSLDTNAGNVLGAIPTLDANGHIKTTQLPDLSITSVTSGLLANRPDPNNDNIGDIYITTDTFQTFISTSTDWSEILNPNSTSIANLQNELNTTQTSLGLNNDASRPVYSSTNYIDNTDSHHVAIGNLDTQIKSNTDILDSLGDASLLDEENVFLVANSFNEIAGDNDAKANARTNLGLGTASTYNVSTNTANTIPLLNNQGRLVDCIDYGSVADAYNANTDFTIDYQDAGIDGPTPLNAEELLVSLNAEELLQEFLVYANEDYGCLIS